MMKADGVPSGVTVEEACSSPVFIDNPSREMVYPSLIQYHGSKVSDRPSWGTVEIPSFLSTARRRYHQKVMPQADVVIVSAYRTPIGRYGGSFRNVHPAELGATAARAAIERGGIAPDSIDEVLMGHGRQAGSGPNPARQVGRRAGLPDTVPAQTINKACASGMQAVATGAQSILLGESTVVLAGGMESMSRMPYLIDSEDARWGHKMGNFTLVDAMYRDGFTCSLSGMIMGETVELLARDYGISREASEAYALETQRRAGAAISSGRFREELAPVTVTDARGR